MRGPSVGEAIAREAESWIGTPFAWQQSAKGKGADCKGLVAGVARELGRPEADSFEANMAGEYRNGHVPTRALRRGLARLFDRVDDMQPGDVLLLKVGAKPQHLGIYVGSGRMVHTHIGVGQVRSSPLGNGGPYSWLTAIVSIWRWRD